METSERREMWLGTPSRAIVALTAVLTALGLVLIFSSSYLVAALGHSGNGYLFVERQAAWLLLALPVAWLAAKVDYRRLRRYDGALLCLAYGCLAIVLVPVIGSQYNGARRWIRFGALGFQPTEFAKLAVIFFLASFAARDPERLRDFRRGFLPALAALGAACALIALEPDIGSAAFLAGVGLTLLLVAGLRARHLLPLVLLVGPLAVAWVVWRHPHVRERLLTFLDPSADPLGGGHQITQALIALGAGGPIGTGLGAGTQKWFFLPERHTDFIFAVAGEELGFFGALALLALFALFVVAGRAALRRAPDLFGSLLAFGLVWMIGLQAAMNVAVVTALVPTKGIPLPFLSYGGSPLFFTLIGVALLVNVARQGEQTAAPEPAGGPEGTIDTRPAGVDLPAAVGEPCVA
ncbi:MAG: putative lipid II flippase FtsW [Planctomycetes bacterium]|nr:putative lipid II flippase FtsW [Planctomycetota bacterium]